MHIFSLVPDVSLFSRTKLSLSSGDSSITINYRETEEIYDGLYAIHYGSNTSDETIFLVCTTPETYFKVFLESSILGILVIFLM